MTDAEQQDNVGVIEVHHEGGLLQEQRPVSAVAGGE